VKEKRTIDFYYNELAARIEEENRMRLQSEQLRLPSRATVARRLSERDGEALLNGRPGQRRSRSQTRQLGKMDYPSVPLRLVEVDHTQLDVIVVDPVNRTSIGRPFLTLALDTATRYVLGICLGFEPPSYRTVADCLLHAILPKDVQQRFDLDHPWLSFGVPEELTLDNGKEFRGKDLAAACEALNIKATYAPARTPEAKPAVERFFGTLNTGLIHTLPGTTFSSLQARRNYASEEEAALTLDELARLIVIFIVDGYSQNLHTGIQTTPALAWQEALESGLLVPRVPNLTEVELKILLGATGGGTISASGIRFKNIWYNSQELKALRMRAHSNNNRKVRFKYDPADLGTIYVHDTFDGRYIEVKAIDQDYASGLSMYNHKILTKQMRSDSSRSDPVAKAVLRRKLDSESAEAVADKKRKHSARSERSRNRGNAVAPITRNPAANVPEDAGHTEAIDEFDDLDEIWEASDESALNDEGYRLVNQVGANDFSDFE
jgi:putative transposase